jgi:hypothetical protein
MAARMEYDEYNLEGARMRPHYPWGTKAFLYYSIAPEKPRIAGELRLRVVSSDDPASFESGSDLLLTNGRPWMRPLYGLSKYHLPLYEKLREDQIIPDDLDSVLSKLPSGSLKNRRSQLLYTLNDTFILDFSSASYFFVITEQGVEQLPLKSIFWDSRTPHNHTPIKPYTGAYTNLHFSILIY